MFSRKNIYSNSVSSRGHFINTPTSFPLSSKKPTLHQTLPDDIGIISRSSHNIHSSSCP